jgi:hypothetical protein
LAPLWTVGGDSKFPLTSSIRFDNVLSGHHYDKFLVVTQLTKNDNPPGRDRQHAHKLTIQRTKTNDADSPSASGNAVPAAAGHHRCNCKAATSESWLDESNPTTTTTTTMGDYLHTNKGATMAVTVPTTSSFLSWTMTRSFLSLRAAYWTCGLLPSTAVQRSRCFSTDSSGSGRSTTTATSSGTGRSVSWLDVYPTVREIRDDIITDHDTVPLLRPAPFPDDVAVDGRRAQVERRQQQLPEPSSRPVHSSHDHHERSRSVGFMPLPGARSFVDDYVLTRPVRIYMVVAYCGG